MLFKKSPAISLSDFLEVSKTTSLKHYLSCRLKLKVAVLISNN